MSIRSVDMQHTIQQTASAEKVQAVERGQAEQQGPQFGQQLQRLEQERHTTVVNSRETQEARAADNEREPGERRKKRRRPRVDQAVAAAEAQRSGDDTPHLIDIRV
jgi:hypothetical protein